MEITLTELAAEKIKEIKTAEDIESGMVLRVKVSGGGCSGFQYDLFFDAKQEDDIEFNFYNVDVVIDQMSIQYLDGTTLDYVDGLQGAGFKFSNPQTTSTCGCGQSFSV